MCLVDAVFTLTPLPKIADFRGSDARMIEMGCKQTLFAAIKLHGRGREEMAKLKKRENLKTMSRMPVLDKERGSKEESKAVLRAATRALEEKNGDDNPGMTVAALRRLEIQVAGILSTIESISKVDQEEDKVSPMPLQASAPVSPLEVVGVPPPLVPPRVRLTLFASFSHSLPLTSLATIVQLKCSLGEKRKLHRICL